MERNKVLLISPSKGLEVGKPEKPRFQVHPLSLLYLAIVLEKEGYNVKICDAYSFGFDLDHIKSQIVSFSPDIIGISAMTILAPSAYLIASESKKINPSIITIMGGPHATALPEEALIDGNIDIAILGEGEYAMLEVCNNIRNGDHDFSSVHGIVYRQKGEIKQTEVKGPVMNIDVLPFPAYHLLPRMKEYNPPPHWGKKGRFASMLTSRGCPYGCIFCSVTRVWGKHYRYRSTDNVLKELELLHERYKIRYISFRDSTLTLNKDRVINLCNGIIKIGLDIKWNCNARVNEIDEDILPLMKRAGCESIQYGIECGEENMLKRFKNFNKTSVRRAIVLTDKNDIKAHGYFMIGLPGESKDTIKETIEFARSLPLYSAGFTTVTPFPGSDLWDYCMQNDLILTKDWSKYDLKGSSVVKYPNFTSEEILQSQKRAFQSFYLRPRIVFHHLSKIKNFNDLYNYFIEAYINLK